LCSILYERNTFVGKLYMHWISLWSRMKRILVVLLIEVSILNYVMWRDPFCGYFVEPCGSFNVLVESQFVHSSIVGCVYFNDCYDVSPSLALVHASYVTIVECLLRKGVRNDSCAIQSLDANEQPGSENISSGILETECWNSILKLWKSLNFDVGNDIDWYINRTVSMGVLSIIPFLRKIHYPCYPNCIFSFLVLLLLNFKENSVWKRKDDVQVK